MKTKKYNSMRPLTEIALKYSISLTDVYNVYTLAVQRQYFKTNEFTPSNLSKLEKVAVDVTTRFYSIYNETRKENTPKEQL